MESGRRWEVARREERRRTGIIFVEDLCTWIQWGLAVALEFVHVCYLAVDPLYLIAEWRTKSALFT